MQPGKDITTHTNVNITHNAILPASYITAGKIFRLHTASFGAKKAFKCKVPKNKCKIQVLSKIGGLFGLSQLLLDRFTYGFRDNLLLWLSNFKGNPAITQKQIICDGQKHLENENDKWIVISCMMCDWRLVQVYKRSTNAYFKCLTWTIWSC